MLLCCFLYLCTPTSLTEPEMIHELRAFSFCSTSEATSTTGRVEAPLANPATFVVLAVVHLFVVFWSEGHCFVADHTTYIAVWELTSFAQPLFHLPT